MCASVYECVSPPLFSITEQELAPLHAQLAELEARTKEQVNLWVCVCVCVCVRERERGGRVVHRVYSILAGGLDQDYEG